MITIFGIRLYHDKKSRNENRNEMDTVNISERERGRGWEHDCGRGEIRSTDLALPRSTALA